MNRIYYSLFLILFFNVLVYSEPIVLNGKMLPDLIGEPVRSIRVLDSKGKVIPFQIDEVTPEGEYVLNQGDKPNGADGNGVFDKQDEIVFLWKDADTAGFRPAEKKREVLAVVEREGNSRAVMLRVDSSVPLSKKRYIEYNDSKQFINTPYYYADFGKDRFHFTRAGVKNFKTGEYIHLTNELRVKILLKALWGLVPIRYSEENVVCLVRRYKCGPVRLIRRGDFHLNLGLGVKGSKASVNQICYPQMVKVPVRLHVPFRFRTFFSQAFLEMTPVIRKTGSSFKFTVPSGNLSIPFSQGSADTLFHSIPDGKFFTVHKNGTGYGWLLQSTIKKSFLKGSGFVFRKPSRRSGYADCGYHLTVKDVPKGYYYITNWVVFSGGSYSNLLENYRSLKSAASIEINGRTHSNRLSLLSPLRVKK
ncbi:MAG: hypothetical protein ACLFQB_07435 [Chitinispirillaceae bacterium]